MARRHAGFTVLELLAAILIVGIVMTGVTQVFSLHTRVYGQQNARMAAQTNLRLAMDMVTDTLRDARYGAPKQDLPSWIPWMPGVTSNPMIVADGPDTARISVASATAQPIAVLGAAALKSDTTIVLDGLDGVDTGSRQLLLIDDSENVLVRTIGGRTVTIDTNPILQDNQGLGRGYPAGTPVYRVDVITFALAADAAGDLQLMRDENHGEGPQAAVAGVAAMTIATLAAGQQYLLRLTAETPETDPLTGNYLRTSLESHIALSN